jgi:hypothetical protein
LELVLGHISLLNYVPNRKRPSAGYYHAKDEQSHPNMPLCLGKKSGVSLKIRSMVRQLL